MKKLLLTQFAIMIMLFHACNLSKSDSKDSKTGFDYVVDQFADIRILRYQVPGFENLSLDQKMLVYYLSKAARCGRDILFDQNGRYSLTIRHTLENIYLTYHGDRKSEEFIAFMEYLKRIWFSNGIYHHYSSDKILPGFSEEYFRTLVSASDQKGFPLLEGETLDILLEGIGPVIFNPGVMPRKVSQNIAADLVTQSAVNFYRNVTQQEAEQFYNSLKNRSDTRPVSVGLNSRLVRDNGKIVEEIWKLDGTYSQAIEHIINWLRKAAEVAENDLQRNIIGTLIDYYKTGDLKIWDDYNILWVQDTQSAIDFINGFIETYADPMGMKATWESVVQIVDDEATRRTEVISNNAQWFEDNSPVDPRFRKSQVTGVSARVVTVAQLGGDCYPHTPIGINLPNADWIRKEHGSKSVTLGNISYAFDQANQGTGFIEEFASSQEEIDLLKKHGFLAGNLHTDLHECLGHGSGQLLPGVSVDALKNFHSPLEETRADLFALYYMMDPKMVELGLMPSLEVAKAAYSQYIRNGLMTQLTRIEPGKNIEQAHMRNRQLIATWCYEKGAPDKVIEQLEVEGKTYFRVNDFQKLRALFAHLLKEVQRIKSEGDYQAGMELVESYGVNVDRELHHEVLERYGKLGLAPFSGFINPDFILIEKGGKIVDVKVLYTDNYVDQMLQYSRDYSLLPARGE